MRRFFAPLLLVLSSLSLASPAQDLFDQASFYLEFYYNGSSTVNLKDFTASYQKNLDQACASEKDTCAFDKALPIINQMVQALGDGHTYYQTPEDLGRFDQSRTGDAPSPRPRIGIEHREIPGSRDRLVMDVVEGSPADEAGLQYGDRIVAINGKVLNELASSNEVVALLTSSVETGKAITLTILRGVQRSKLDLTITPRQINQARLPSLKVRPDNVAVLKIPDFLVNGQVGSRVHALVREAQQKGAKAMILELRGNSGGSALEALISMAAFIDKPYILFSDRYDSESKEYLVENTRAIVRNAKDKIRESVIPIPNFAR